MNNIQDPRSHSLHIFLFSMLLQGGNSNLKKRKETVPLLWPQLYCVWGESMLVTATAAMSGVRRSFALGSDVVAQFPPACF